MAFSASTGHFKLKIYLNNVLITDETIQIVLDATVDNWDNPKKNNKKIREIDVNFNTRGAITATVTSKSNTLQSDNGSAGSVYYQIIYFMMKFSGLNPNLYISKVEIQPQCRTSRFNNNYYNSANNGANYFTGKLGQTDTSKFVLSSELTGVPFQVNVNQTSINVCSVCNGDTPQNNSIYNIYFNTRTSNIINFDLNGGSGIFSPITQQSGTHVILPSSSPTRSHTISFDCANHGAANALTYNAKFSGWQYGNDVYKPGTSVMFNKNVTLKAKWEFSTVTLSTLPNPGQVQTGYKFDGWYSNNAYTSSPTTLSMNQNYTLYAKWQYKIILDAQSGNLIVNSVDGTCAQKLEYWKKHGEDFSIPNVEFQYRGTQYSLDESSNFKGFYTNISGTGTCYKLGSNVKANTPTTLYALFEKKKIKVTFKTGWGQNVTIKTDTVEYSGDATPPKFDGNNAKYKHDKGYSFVGWSGKYKNVKEDSVVTAIWNFSPIWIYKNVGGTKKWIQYEPTDPNEDDQE